MMNSRNAVNVERAVRARYRALLPKYGDLWRSMAPPLAAADTTTREPLSLLSAIENGQSISLRVPSKCNECPWDSTCQGCAEPIVEVENEGSPSSQSSASSEDTAPVRFDLSFIRLDGEESEDNAPSPLTQPFARQESSNSGDVGDDESMASSSSSSSESMKGWDLSGLRLNDDEESKKSESTSESIVQRDKRKAKQASQVINLLHDSDSETNNFTSRPARVVFASDSSSEEEEWDESKKPPTKEEDSIARSPTVIVLSDSDDDLNNSWLDTDEESIGGDEKRKNVNRTESSAKRVAFAPDKTAKRTEIVTQTSKIPRKNKGQSKASFRKQREEIADTAFAEFDRLAFDSALLDVELVFSNKLRTTAGLTRLKQRSGGGGPTKRIATIELSTKIIDEEHRLRSTLLHEMCHAAAWLVDGVSKPPHGACFKKWANIAMQNVRNVNVTTTHDYEISFKYAWACTAPKCGVVIQRHSRSVDPTRHCCGKCKSKLIEIEVPSQKDGNVQHTPRKKAPLSGYNLFVKQNSRSVRERLTSDRERQGIQSKVTQPEVMKECARLWREKNQGSKK